VDGTTKMRHMESVATLQPRAVPDSSTGLWEGARPPPLTSSFGPVDKRSLLPGGRTGYHRLVSGSHFLSIDHRRFFI
jgi:hypothetical protein